jgi:hypothetical protein
MQAVITLYNIEPLSSAGSEYRGVVLTLSPEGEGSVAARLVQRESGVSASRRVSSKAANSSASFTSAILTAY